MLSEPGREARIVFVSAAGTLEETVGAPGAHHDMTLVPGGGLAWLSSSERQVEGLGLVNCDEVTVRTGAGEEHVLFSSWDAFPPSAPYTGDLPPAGAALDWTHANGIYYSADRNSYLVSLGELNTFLEVGAEDGEVLWSQEGASVQPAEAGFLFQHAPSWTPDGNVLLFANTGPGRSVSWAAELDVDGLGDAEEVWVGGLDDGLSTPARGSVERLANGNTLMEYGGLGVVREISDHGTIVREIELPSGAGINSLTLLDVFVTGPLDAPDAG